ncbi:MAG TPA: VOC family protein [Bdellovibrionota bacterium]|nr:VOC family protein [Bdellovibrionota bacterium]
MAKKANWIPEGYHAVTPYLTIRNAAKALEFYKKAFGAEELTRMPGPGGSLMHAEIKIGDSIVMMGEEAPDRGQKSPQGLNGTPVGLFIYVKDVDKAFQRAADAGAKAIMPVADMFWGDRYGQLEDPFGHRWSLGTHKEDLTPAEIEKRAQAFFCK